MTNDFSYNKKWIKHITLITSLLFIIFLSLLLLNEDLLYYKIFSNIKVINVILLTLFVLFTLITVLFNNKIRRENVFKQKQTNLGVYLTLSGSLIIVFMLFYISLESYSIFDLINPYILFLGSIIICLTGLYLNYTFLDDNIYSLLVRNKNYTIRLLFSVSFIFIYLLFNTIFGYYFIFLVIIFWVDLIFIKILLPLTVFILKTSYNISKSIVLFIIGIPSMIYKVTSGIVNYIFNFSFKSYNKTRTLSLRLGFSWIHIFTILLFSIGCSIFFSQIIIFFLVLLLIQILFVFYLTRSLNRLHGNLDYYQFEEKIENKYFYQLYVTFFIIFLFIFEVVNSFIKLYFIIDPIYSMIFAITLILLAVGISLRKIFLAVLNFIVYGTKSIIFSSLIYTKKVVVLTKTSKLLALQLFLTAFGLTLFLRLNIYVYFLVFIFILIFLKTISVNEGIKINFSNLLKKTKDTENNSLVNLRKISSLLKIYLFLSLILFSYLLTISTLFIFQQYFSNINVIFIAFLLIIFPNSIFIINILQHTLIILGNLSKRFISYVRFNTYDKIQFIYVINIKNGILTNFDFIKLGLNVLLISLVLFTIFSSWFTNIFIVSVLYTLLSIFWLFFLQDLYAKFFSIINLEKQTKDESEVKVLFNTLKNFIFDSQTNLERDPKTELRKLKWDSRILFGYPSIVIANLLLNVMYPYIRSFTTLVLFVFLTLLVITNMPFFSNIVFNVANKLLNLMKSIALFLYEFMQYLIISFIRTMQEIFYAMVRLFYSIYFLLTQKGKMSLTIDFTFILFMISIIGSIFFSDNLPSTEIFIVSLGFIYVLGLGTIWIQNILHFVGNLLNLVYLFIVKISKSIYFIVALQGRRSASIDLFIILLSIESVTSFIFGFDLSITLLFIGLFLVGLAIIWNEIIINSMITFMGHVSKLSKHVYRQLVTLSSKIAHSIQYAFKQLVNWFIFYASILFSIIFILFGFIYAISGILNDSGEFMASILFDINLLFGLTNIANIILILLGVAFIFAGLLLIRIINENKEKLLLHVFEMQKQKTFSNYEVLK